MRAGGRDAAGNSGSPLDGPGSQLRGHRETCMSTETHGRTLWIKCIFKHLQGGPDVRFVSAGGQNFTDTITRILLFNYHLTREGLAESNCSCNKREHMKAWREKHLKNIQTSEGKHHVYHAVSSCRLTVQPVGLQEVVQKAVTYISIQEIVAGEQGMERLQLATFNLINAKYKDMRC